METYLRKYIVFLPVLVVAICASFTAIAVNHLMEEKVLGDSPKLGKVTKIAFAKKKKKEAKKSKDGEPVLKRNMFCSSCIPPEPEEGETKIVDSNQPPITSLPLRLVATNVSSQFQYSMATIQNTSTFREGGYSVKQMIPEAGEVVRIGTQFVDFENKSTKRMERIRLLSARSAPIRSTSSSIKKKSNKPKNEVMAMVEEGVKKVSDTEYELDKKVVDKILENPMAVAKGARITPSIKNGKPNGFKLYAIRSNSVFAKIGLKNGDTLHAVNGLELSSIDQAMKVYAKLRNSSNISVSATRRGAPVSLNYSIR